MPYKNLKLTYLTTGGSFLLRYVLWFCKSYCNCIYIIFSLSTKEWTPCLQWFRLLPCQIFNSPSDKVKQYPYCKLAALPPNPTPIHKLLQLGSVVSPALQHSQHPSASHYTTAPALSTEGHTRCLI